jgi:hypothetical protein
MHWLDPDYLPETIGAVAQFLINPHGEIDGLILEDGTEIHTPPHLSGKIGKTVRKGDRIKVRGVRPRGADVIACVAIDTAKGGRILDEGPPDTHKPEKHDARKHAEASAKPGRAEGIVARALHGPKGEIRGVLLKDGTIIRFPKHESERLKSVTKAGAKFAARGKIIANNFGRVLKAHEAGSSEKSLKAFAPKAPKHDKPHPKKPHPAQDRHA